MSVFELLFEPGLGFSAGWSPALVSIFRSRTLVGQGVATGGDDRVSFFYTVGDLNQFCIADADANGLEMCLAVGTRSNDVIVPSSFFLKTALTGTTTAFLSERAVIESWTVIPGFKASLGFFDSTHTSIVVLPGSSAGLTRLTLPLHGSLNPAARNSAGLPTFKEAAWD